MNIVAKTQKYESLLNELFKLKQFIDQSKMAREAFVENKEILKRELQKY